MNKLEEVGKQIKALNERTEILQQVYDELAAEKDKPEYPDGTFGKFFDNNSNRYIYDYLRQTKEDGFYDIGNVRWDNFEPLTEAIMPMPIEHDGGAYPGDPKDYIFAEWVNGDSIIEYYCEARYISFINIISYQIIKRAEK